MMPFRTVWFLGFAGVVVAGVGACDGPEELDGEVTSLVVRGVVEDVAGVPVAGAVVHVGWGGGLCDEPQPFPPDTTDAAGAFEVMPWTWGTLSEACVTVRAEPPAGSALLEAQLQVDNVALRSKNGPDTLSVRLTLNPS